MVRGWHIFALLASFASLCRSQSTTFNLNMVIAAIDKDNDHNMTQSEVERFFITNVGRNVTGRCGFVNWLVNNFGGNSLRVSALFDVIQSNDRQVGLAEVTKAFLGNPSATVTTTSGFMASIKALDDLIDKIITKSADYTNGPTFWSYTQFEILQWANNSDLDQNGYMSRLEVSQAMRGLDENGDWDIMRCEYVNSMTSHKQHTVAASKVYDVIFKERDLTWADVDSDFLMSMMRRRDGVVTKQMFIDFFTRQNQLAAGVPASYEEWSGGDNGSNGPVSDVTIWCMTSSVLVLFVSAIFI